MNVSHHPLYKGDGDKDYQKHQFQNIKLNMKPKYRVNAREESPTEEKLRVDL